MGDMKITYLDGMGDFGLRRREGLHQRPRRLSNECPNVGKFISNLKFDLPMENELMDSILKGTDAERGGDGSG